MAQARHPRGIHPLLRRALLSAVLVGGGILGVAPADAREAAEPQAHITLGAGGVFVPGPLGNRPTLTLRANRAVSEQISIGALAASSRHTVRDVTLHLAHAAAELEWRIDRGAIVPTVHLGGGLLVVLTGGASQPLPVLHVGGGADWWPAGPYHGLSLGAELRYVGSPSFSFTPILSTLTLRVGWGF